VGLGYGWAGLPGAAFDPFLIAEKLCTYRPKPFKSLYFSIARNLQF